MNTIENIEAPTEAAVAPAPAQIPSETPALVSQPVVSPPPSSLPSPLQALRSPLLAPPSGPSSLQAPRSEPFSLKPSAFSLPSPVLHPGEVAFANESRFNAAFFSEPLTEFAAGWREPNNLEALLDFLAPPVQVSRRFEYKKADNAEAFLSDADDARAIGSDFKHVEYRGASVNDKTYNRGLTIRLDLDAIGDLPDWRELFTTRLMQRILRSELRRAIDQLVNNAANANKSWDSSAGKDPDQDLLSEMILAVDASGIRPNRVLFGDVAWNKRLIAHRAQATAGGFASSVLSLDQLASFLGVDAVRVSRERYQSSATAKSKITPDVVLLFCGQDAATADDPTHLKRFWSSVEGGGRFRVYEQQVSAKMVDLSVEHYSNLLLTSSVGLRKLTIL